jgi:plastocyanin
VGNSDDPTTPASTGGGDPPGAIDDGGVQPTVNVLAPLKTSVTTTAAKWVAPGTSIDVAATAPSTAKGTTTYTWATGALPGTVATTATLNTKDIQPSASGQLKYATAGVYRMHCHPHPAMKHNVTVIDGYKGPSTVHVQLVDGTKLADYRFVPENILVGKDTTVVYHNNGTQMHTATAEAQEPPLKLADLKTASGAVTLSGDGWQRVLVVVQDAGGRIGSAQHDIYVSAPPKDFTDEFPFEFTAGAISTIPQDTSTVQAPGKATFALDFPGQLFLNWTATDAAVNEGAPADANTAEAEVHLKQASAEQDVITGAPSAAGADSTHVQAGSYSLEVLPTAGVKPTVIVTVTVIYDLVPPAPAMAAAGGGHGDHAGH